MKINKKLKTSFISSLTLIASAISVVACGNKPNPGDKNYQNFVNKLTSIDLQKISLSKTSVKNFWDTHQVCGYEDYSVTDKNFKEDQLSFYNISDYKNIGKTITSEKLTDLKDGKINYDSKGNMIINLDDHPVTLNNILFSENFDLKISTNKHEPKNNGVIFKDVTLFFSINATKDNVNLNNWDNEESSIKLIGKPNFNFNQVKLDTNNGFKSDDQHLGLKNNSNKNTYWDYSNWTTDVDSINWTLDPSKIKTIEQFSTLFTNASNSFTTSKDKDNPNLIDFNFNASNIFAYFEITGKAKKASKDIDLMAKFVGMFNKNNPTLKFDSNYFVEFNAS